MSTILFVDAYDSFSRNIIALLYDCIANVQVTTIHIDTNIEQAFKCEFESFLSSFDAIILGPGPGDPRDNNDIGLFRTVWRVAERQKLPVLGICLGFQSLCLHYGLSVIRMREPCHGQTKAIKSNMLDVFENLPDVVSMNYNSLGVSKSEWPIHKQEHRFHDAGADSGYSSDSSNLQASSSSDSENENSLRLLAWDDEGYAMAVRHASLPLWGFQFHPESCMSNSSCQRLIRNWWSRATLHNALNERTISRKQILTLKSGSENSERLDVLLSLNQNAIRDADPMNTYTRGESGIQWNVIGNSGLTMEDLSSYCHEFNSTGTLAMLESTAKGRYCVYTFSDEHSERVSYMNGQMVRSKGTTESTVHTILPVEALQVLEATTKSQKVNGGCKDIPFWGGYVGYISYEMSLDILHESIAKNSSLKQRTAPDFNFVFVQRSIVLDKETGSIYIQSIREHDKAWIETTQDHLLKFSSCKRQTVSRPGDLNHNLKQLLDSAKIELPDHDRYTSQIQTCQAHLRAGNSYELCLTTEATIITSANDSNAPYTLYRNLNKHNPVPFASYLHFPALTGPNIPATSILSTSPEQFMSWSRTGTIDMTPMKGTVPRLTATTPSLAEATAILRNPKESAENLMIADLIRHDLHGVVGCRPYNHTASLANSTAAPQSQSSVEIVKLNEITPYETVYQLTSHIRAHPPPSLDPQNINEVIAHNHSSLLHTLPPGSMTGAPKRRSCQILRDLEQRDRGVYSGIIGYMDVGGGGCWSVAIRTAWSSSAEDVQVASQPNVELTDEVMEQESKATLGDATIDKFQTWHVGAGGAITVLSDVEGEWDEMVGKLRSVLKGFRS